MLNQEHSTSFQSDLSADQTNEHKAIRPHETDLNGDSDGQISAAQQLRLSEVDRLRDIIVGPQMEDYERRFSDLRRSLDRLVTELRHMRDHSDEVEKAQARRIETLEAENRRLSDELRREGERQRVREGIIQKILAQLRQQDMVAQSLAKNANDFRKLLDQYETDIRALNVTTNEYREQHERVHQAIRHEVRQTEDTLRDELRRSTDRLDLQKTDRKTLSGMLMEIAMRLETGGSMASLLEDLTTRSEE